MPRYIAVHPVAFKDEDMLALLARRDELPSTLAWRTSFIAEADHVTYCEWDAPSAHLLEEVFGAFGVPFVSVQEVRVFDPAAYVAQAA